MIYFEVPNTTAISADIKTVIKCMSIYEFIRLNIVLILDK